MNTLRARAMPWPTPRWAPSGVIQAYDAVTGQMRWAWDMMRPDSSGPPPAGQSFTRGTPNMWTIASGDESLGLVYLPMGNAAADYYSSLRRPQENRYATSLVAIDLATGRTIWDRPFGTARTNGPFGIPSMLPLIIGTPNNGGSVVTKSGLIFIAAATDNLIRAVDLRSGRQLWSAPLPGGGQSTPMTYSQGGKQFLVIMAGGHHFMETPVGDELVAYALP